MYCYICIKYMYLYVLLRIYKEHTHKVQCSTVQNRNESRAEYINIVQNSKCVQYRNVCAYIFSHAWVYIYSRICLYLPKYIHALMHTRAALVRERRIWMWSLAVHVELSALAISTYMDFAQASAVISAYIYVFMCEYNYIYIYIYIYKHI
jgi:hypothetical protein